MSSVGSRVEGRSGSKRQHRGFARMVAVSVAAVLVVALGLVAVAPARGAEVVGSTSASVGASAAQRSVAPRAVRLDGGAIAKWVAEKIAGAAVGKVGGWVMDAIGFNSLFPNPTVQELNEISDKLDELSPR